MARVKTASRKTKRTTTRKTRKPAAKKGRKVAKAKRISKAAPKNPIVTFNFHTYGHDLSVAGYSLSSFAIQVLSKIFNRDLSKLANKGYEALIQVRVLKAAKLRSISKDTVTANIRIRTSPNYISLSHEEASVEFDLCDRWMHDVSKLFRRPDMSFFEDFPEPVTPFDETPEESRYYALVAPAVVQVKIRTCR